MTPETPIEIQHHRASVENRGSTVVSRSPRMLSTIIVNPPIQAPAASTCTISDGAAMSCPDCAVCPPRAQGIRAPTISPVASTAGEALRTGSRR